MVRVLGGGKVNYPEDKDSQLFEHPRAEELLAYLYSYVLFSEDVDTDSFNQQEFGSVSAHVQAEIDVWIGSIDPQPLRPDHPSFMFRFSRIYGGVQWHFQPAGSKLYNIRFDSDRRVSQSIYAHMDVENAMGVDGPRILQVSLGSADLDFLISQQLERGHVRVLSVKGTGILALLLPRSESGEHTVLPLPGLSIGAKDFFVEQDAHATIQLSTFFREFKPVS